MFSGQEATCCNHMCCAHCGYEIPYYDRRDKYEWSYDCEGEKIFRKDLEVLIASCCPKDKRMLCGLLKQCLDHNGIDALEDLPRLGYRISPMNDEQQTMIHLAFYKKAHETLNYGDGSILFKKFKDHVNYVDCYGLSHLHIACVTGDTKVVKEFLDKGEDVNAKFHSDPEGTRTNFTPLHFAVANECIIVAELLLQYGAHAHAADSQGKTPLHVACGDVEIILRRIQTCEPLDFMNERSSPLKSISGLAIVELLLNYGGDPNARDEQGNTPLFYCFQKLDVSTIRVDSCKDQRIAALKTKQRKIVEILVQYGADATVINSNNENILHLIVKDLQFLRSPIVYSNISFDDTPYAELIELILATNQELDVDAKNSFGETPLQLAVSLMSVEVIKVLLKHNADFEKFNQNKPMQFVYPNIPLNLEAVQNITSMIELLSDQEYYFTLEDNLAVMKLLVHESKKCDCILAKGDENEECIIVNALYYGSTTHFNYIVKKIRETLTIRPKKSCFSYGQSKIEKLPEHIYYYLDCKKKLGLFDNKQNIFKKLKNMKYNDYTLRKLIESLDSEVARMKNTALEGGVMLFSLMKKHYSTIYDHIKGKDIHKLAADFPSYEKLIKGHVAKSLTRRYLENTAGNYLKLLLPALPDVCCRMIVFRLSNEDILHLSVAALILPSLPS